VLFHRRTKAVPASATEATAIAYAHNPIKRRGTRIWVTRQTDDEKLAQLHARLTRAVNLAKMTDANGEWNGVCGTRTMGPDCTMARSFAGAGHG
jgi:hypothetical protein